MNFKRFSFIFLLAIGTGGCGTVSQSPVQPKHSLNGTVEIISKNEYGYTVTAEFVDRYNALIEVYGNTKYPNGAPIFIPTCKRNDGITSNGNGTYTMTYKAMENMMVMQNLHTLAFKP